jgi:hypothetical protein
VVPDKAWGFKSPLRHSFPPRINIAIYLRAYHLETTYPLLAQYPKDVAVSLHQRGMYYHERSTHLVPYFNAEVVDLYGSGITDEETRVEQEYEALEQDIAQEVVRLGRSIYTAFRGGVFLSDQR